MKKIIYTFIFLLPLLLISCGTDKQGSTPFGWIILGFIITIPAIAWMMSRDKDQDYKENPKERLLPTNEMPGQKPKTDFWGTVIIWVFMALIAGTFVWLIFG